MIKFGTNGWRGLIARDFTYENLQSVALATAKYVKSINKENPSVVIGYDTRFLSKEFAQEVAQVLAWQNITVHLTNSFCSTPQLSFQAKQKIVDLGVVITASHNPPLYNGFKLKANFGGPATPEQIACVEKELKKILQRRPKFNFKPFEFYLNTNRIRFFDAEPSYLRHIKKKIDIAAILDAKFKILYDPMYGAGMNSLNSIIPNIEQIHSDFNPSFGDIDHPEPMPPQLDTLQKKVVEGKFDIGIATDGDADRLGLIDNEGNFVDSHKIFIILLKYIFNEKKKRGIVAKTVSLTSMVDKFCEKNKIELEETAVGFKHIAKLMNEKKVIIGGEESGGLGTILHIPERDGMFNALLILEIMAKQGKTLKQLSDELDEEFGPHRFLRRDKNVTQQQKSAILNACQKNPTKIGRYEVKSTNHKDGYKFFVDNGWLLIRPSGTEPLIRFYAEAENINKVNELLDEGMKLK